MKRQLKKTAQFIAVLGFTMITLVACEDVDQEIFDSADLQEEQETDEENEKKQKPKLNN